MPTVIDQIIVELGLDTKDFKPEQLKAAAANFKMRDAALGYAKGGTEQAGKLDEAFGVVQGRLLGFFAAVLAVNAVANISKETADVGGNLGRLSEQLKMSAQDLSAWQRAGKMVGATESEITSSIQTLVSSIEKQKMGMASFNVSILNQMGIFPGKGKNGQYDPDDILKQMSRWAKTQGNKRYASEMLRQAGMTPGMVTLLLAGPEKLERWLKANKRIAPTPEQIEKLTKLQDAWGRVTSVAELLGKRLVAVFMPWLKRAIEIIKALLRIQKWESDHRKDQYDVSKPMRERNPFIRQLEGAYQLFREGKTSIGPAGEGGGEAGGTPKTLGGYQKHVEQQSQGPAGPRRPFGSGKLFDPVTGTSLGGGVGSSSASMGAHRHQGQDIMARYGSSIYAAKSGVIDHIGTDNWGTPVVVIRHPDGTYTRYMHLSAVGVKAGDKVEGGSVIGKSGTANSVPHLHFETWMGAPNRSGSQLLDPRSIYGWNKSHLPQGGEAVPNGEQSADKFGGGATPIPWLNAPGAAPMNEERDFQKNSSIDELHLGKVTIRSTASDPYSIAKELGATLDRNSLMNSGNFSMG